MINKIDSEINNKENMIAELNKEMEYKHEIQKLNNEKKGAII